ncbi:MAG: cysteine desulfurase [Chitinophagaceae bacterium]|nr:MAG: cysteine desulfurase [Chitinophagaceae bacterium]
MTSLNRLSEIRKDFPILSRLVNGLPLVYLDNAATSQKPIKVINALKTYYSETNSNIHRGVHHLSQVATNQYEASRLSIQKFINAAESEEINFTKGTTEAINLVAYSYGRKFVKQGDEIVISALEHHSNIVPWQILCEEKGAVLKIIPIDDEGVLDLKAAESIITDKTKIISLVYVSNALGLKNPVEEIISLARKQKNAVVFLDAAQAVTHFPVDVQKLDCDFLAFSGHKLLGPTGIGVLYGKRKHLEAMLPYQSGGEMIKTVSFEKTTYNELPFKFEAGTPNIAGGIAFKSALEYIEQIGWDFISEQETNLVEYADNGLKKIDGLHIYGGTQKRYGVIAFNVSGIHHYDIGVLLDNLGIAIRTGHHCCQPLMQRFEIEGTCRASFSFYNSEEDADRFVKGVEKAVKMLR